MRFTRSTLLILPGKTEMPAPPAPNYAELCRVWSRLYRYNHLAAIVGWDRNAMMPPKGNDARAAAEAELNALIHRTRTAPRLAEWLRAAEQESLTDVERANLREMRRDWRAANALPESLVEAKTLAGDSGSAFAARQSRRI